MMMNPMMQRPAGQAQPPAPQDIAQRIKGAQLQPQALAKALARTSYSAQALGALARKPDVTDKDVISSTGQAVADGHLTAAEAVKFLATMPPDDQLKPWLDNLYRQNLTGAVHLSAMQAGAPPIAAATPQAPPQQAAPMPQSQTQPPMPSPEPPQATNPMMRA